MLEKYPDCRRDIRKTHTKREKVCIYDQWYIIVLSFLCLLSPGRGRLCGGSTPVPEHKYECRCFLHSETKSGKCILRYFLIFFYSIKKRRCQNEKRKQKESLLNHQDRMKFVSWTCLRGVSSIESSSSCSLSQSQGAFRFLLLHSQPLLWLVLATSSASGSSEGA